MTPTPQPRASTLAWAVLFLINGGAGVIHPQQWWALLWFAGMTCWGAFQLKQFTQQVIVWADRPRTRDPEEERP